MDVSYAIEKANANEDIKKLRDYFLCSCFACIKHADEKISQWTLLYYNPQANKVVDCFVNDKFVTIGEETPPLAEIEKPDFNGLNVQAEDALATARENFRKSTINVLITLHQNPLKWTINFISSDMMATTVDVDAKSGRITRQEETSLIRRL
ncbi:MAG: PepSY domain-containing protein [Candidatus Aenigmarchaeota archaeon]|nr:PepSY domain-containing protein [Candidatus Aenigmarchaeota archaeon]